MVGCGCSFSLLKMVSLIALQNGPVLPGGSAMVSVAEVGYYGPYESVWLSVGVGPAVRANLWLVGRDDWVALRDLYLPVAV